MQWCTWKNMVRVSDGETGTTTGGASEVDGCSESSAALSSCWVSSSTAFTTRFFFWIVCTFNDEVAERKGKLQKKAKEEGEEKEEESVKEEEEEEEEERRDRDDKSVSVAIFFTHSKEKLLFLFPTPYLFYLSTPERKEHHCILSQINWWFPMLSIKLPLTS